MQNLLSPEKRTVDHWATVQFFFSLTQVRRFLALFLVQGWLGSRNVTAVAHFLKTSVCGGSWCTDSGFSPIPVKLSQVFESSVSDNLSKAAVIPVACAPFSYHTFPFESTFYEYISIQHSVNSQPFQRWPSVAWPSVAYPPCRGCWWSSSGQLSSQ